VLTLERVRGIKITEMAALDAAGLDRGALAARAAALTLRMVFEHGFFHADPHPGNFFVEPGGRIALVDFGMVGTVDEPTREQLMQILLAVTTGNAERLSDALLELGVARQRVDRARLSRDLERLVARHYGQQLRDLALVPLLEEALAIVRRHRLRLPPKLALLLKTVAMYEGLGAQIDPGFRLTTALEPFAQRLLLRQYSPSRWAPKLAQASVDAAFLGTELPHQLRRILSGLERGTIEIGMHPEHVEPLLRRIERLVNRLILGVLAAAFVNGLAVLAAAYHLPGLDPWIAPLFGFGFAVAAVIGVYLAWTIAGPGRG
jgi:ubiquinone biosynthesis protein